MEEKYTWLGTVSAPQEYPMEVYEGAIIADDFTYAFDAIWGTQNTGWGKRRYHERNHRKNGCPS